MSDARRGSAPTGSSGFADDTALHTDGPDAVPAMAIIVKSAGPYLNWCGLEVNMPKSMVSAVDHATDKMVATDSITLNGMPFTVLPPDQLHKHLGLRATIMGDFAAEKAHVLAEMKLQLEALKGNAVLLRSLEELVIKVGVVPVFRYSAGLVDWTKTELEQISKLWIGAFKHAWTLPRSTDSTPLVLDL